MPFAALSLFSTSKRMSSSSSSSSSLDACDPSEAALLVAVADLLPRKFGTPGTVGWLKGIGGAACI